MSSLIFYDESAKVESKVKAAQQKARELSSTLDSLENEFSCKKLATNLPNGHDGSNELQLARTFCVPSLSTVEHFLPPNLDDLAIGHFFHHYVHDFRTNNRVWYIEDGNDCLVSSIKAVGVAGMTRASNGPSSSPEAQQQYLHAIQLTNAALRLPNLAKLDSTLLAINVLGLFESITGFQRSLRSWRDHTIGASALLALRGAEQFETDTGGRLFLQTSINLSIACVQQHLPVPDHLHAMRIEAEKHVPDPSDRVWRFYLSRMRYADMYAKLKPQNLVQTPEDAYAIIQEAMSLEDDIVGLTHGLPRDWQYEVVEATGPTVFAGYCHIFPTFFPAQVWNGMMSTRIHLNDIMIKASQALQLLPATDLPRGAQDRLKNAGKLLARMQLDIFASVPQHLGTGICHAQYTPFPNIEPPAATRISGDCIWRHFTAKDTSPWRSRRKRSPDLPFVRMSGGYLIQWSLYAAGQAGRPGSRSRTFAIEILKHIGREMGVQQALVLATNLEQDSGLKMAVYSSL